jgi:hypothetical protein
MLFRTLCLCLLVAGPLAADSIEVEPPNSGDLIVEKSGPGFYTALVTGDATDTDDALKAEATEGVARWALEGGFRYIALVEWVLLQDPEPLDPALHSDRRHAKAVFAVFSQQPDPKEVPDPIDLNRFFPEPQRSPEDLGPQETPTPVPTATPDKGGKADQGAGQ